MGPSTIHGNVQRRNGVLNNESHIGRPVWNRQRFLKDPDSGKRIARLMRWSLPAGQFGDQFKLGSGFRQAANFCITLSSYASSGARPARAECGRRVL
jgi:hypothetical protein